jgi:hypothetical protein
MNPSHLLRKFLSTGTKPATQREVSAILDESRSLLVSKLPTTAETIQNFSEAEIEAITAGGKPGAMARAHAIYNEKQGRFVKTGKPLAKPTAKAPAPAPAATKPAPVIHRATATATASKPTTIHRAATTAHKPAPSAPSAPSANITAAEFAKPELRMTRAEFDKLSHADRSRFCVSGGRLV